MSRWYWKRAVMALVAGAGVNDMTQAAEPAANPTGYQPNQSIVIKSPGKPDQTVTVVKSTRRADGRVYTEVKDAAGQIYTMIDEAPNGSVDKVSEVLPAGMKESDLPRAKPRDNDVPAMNMVAAAESKRWSLFKRSEKDAPASPPPPPPPPPPAAEKKPSLLSRMFSKSKPETPPAPAPQMPSYAPPAPTYTQPPATAYAPPAPTYAPRPMPTPIPGDYAPPTRGTAQVPMQPAPFAPGVPNQMPAPAQPNLAPWNQVVTPTAPPGVITPVPVPSKVPTPGVTTGTTRINLTPEPPTAKAPTVTAPIVTAPIVTAPVVTAPQYPAVPTAPSIPSIPAMPAVPSMPIPSIPVPAPSYPAPSYPSPVPQSQATPTEGDKVIPISHTIAVLQEGPLSELQPTVDSLHHGHAESDRAMAARILAGGRYASRIEVKGILFAAAKHDASPAVRATCIRELGTLGYFDPTFLRYLTECSADESGIIRDAAAKTLAKLRPAR